jgi:hypothetical protein
LDLKTVRSQDPLYLYQIMLPKSAGAMVFPDATSSFATERPFGHVDMSGRVIIGPKEKPVPLFCER